MNVDIQYQEIASIIENHAPSGWSKIQIPAEVGDDWAEKSYDYWDSNNNQKWFEIEKVDQDIKISRALREIRKQMTIPGQQPWSRCTFTLFPDGKFKFDVEYDD
jgi:Protein of unknown function, DUF600